MKIKSLLVTGMAALTMFSCSNENDPTNIDKEAAKNAAFSFSFTMPNVVKTRAIDAGTAAEQQVNSITLELVYADGATPAITKTYQASEFTPNGSTYTLTEPELVSPGQATMNIYVNTGVSTTVESTSAFDLGDYASTTESNFAMSGEGSVTIVQNQTTTANPVSVSRIAAKLNEVSDADADTEIRELTYTAKATQPRTDAANLTITLLNYSFSNLNKTSNTLASAGKNYTVGNFWHILGTTAVWGDFTATKSIEDQVTYCFENGEDAPTTIWYQAQANFDGYTEGNDFYVYEGLAYTSFDKLNEKFMGGLVALGLTANSPIADFLTKAGVEKFEKGICYYPQEIKTAGKAGIDRNNWYKLGVTGINDLGLPMVVPPPPGAPTLLIFSATVQPWTVVDYGYEL